jgi:hypothetical protein
LYCARQPRLPKCRSRRSARYGRCAERPRIAFRTCSSVRRSSASLLFQVPGMCGLTFASWRSGLRSVCIRASAYAWIYTIAGFTIYLWKQGMYSLDVNAQVSNRCTITKKNRDGRCDVTYPNNRVYRLRLSLEPATSGSRTVDPWFHVQNVRTEIHHALHTRAIWLS